MDQKALRKIDFQNFLKSSFTIFVIIPALFIMYYLISFLWSEFSNAWMESQPEYISYAWSGVGNGLYYSCTVLVAAMLGAHWGKKGKCDFFSMVFFPALLFLVVSILTLTVGPQLPDSIIMAGSDFWNTVFGIPALVYVLPNVLGFYLGFRLWQKKIGGKKEKVCKRANQTPHQTDLFNFLKVSLLLFILAPAILGVRLFLVDPALLFILSDTMWQPSLRLVRFGQMNSLYFFFLACISGKLGAVWGQKGERNFLSMAFFPFLMLTAISLLLYGGTKWLPESVTGGGYHYLVTLFCSPYVLLFGIPIIIGFYVGFRIRRKKLQTI